MLRVIMFFLLGALSATPVLVAPGDAAVLQAQQAFAARKPANLDRAARDVPAEHVLAPYVEFWRQMLTNDGDDARVADFLARHPGSRMAESLRADWLKSLGVREAWPLYLAEYPRLGRPDVAHQCYAYRAEWAQGKQGEIYAEGTGKLIKAGAKIGYDIHYHPVGVVTEGALETGIRVIA